ncbi:response regulator [Caenispirillum salinarum]|nr:response regulator [Caenispirillum salinarum]
MTEDEALHVLVVEDEMLLAVELESGLEDMGHRVMGPFPTVQRALARLASEMPDVALLDVNVGDERVTPVARVLLEAGVPFVLVTGYTAQQLTEPELRDAPRIDKPVDRRQLESVFRALRGGSDG